MVYGRMDNGGYSMTVNDLIRNLKSLKKEIKNKHIQIISQNGVLMNSEIKLVLKDKYDPLNHSADNVDFIIIC